MTTIACNREMMVADSHITDGTTTHHASKIFKIRGGYLGVAGNFAECMAFVSWFRGGCKSDKIPDMKEVSALYLAPTGKITCFDFSPYSFEVKGKFAAIGSGDQGALTMMTAGFTPADAVRMVSKVDPGTGGRLKIRKL